MRLARCQHCGGGSTNGEALLGRGLVVEADHSGDLPLAVFFAPDVDEFGFAYVGGVAGVVEAVHADLDGAVIRSG
jgi:hypothetical protein